MPRVPVEPCGRRARCDAARRKLEIETASLQTGCPVLRRTAGALPSGSYVLPAVTDPGVDMDAETAWPILAATGYSSGTVLSAASFDESQARTPAGAANDVGLALRSPAHRSRDTHAFPPIARGVRWLDVCGGDPPGKEARGTPDTVSGQRVGQRWNFCSELYPQPGLEKWDILSRVPGWHTKRAWLSLATDGAPASIKPSSLPSAHPAE